MASPLTRRSLFGSGALIIATTLATSQQRAFAGMQGIPIQPGPSGTDMSPTIQAEIDVVAGAGGGLVELAAGAFEIGTSLRMRSGVTLQGTGPQSTVLLDHANLSANPILRIVGTSSAPIATVAVNSLGIRNGTASTGVYVGGRDGVLVTDANGITFSGVRIFEIAGTYGLKIHRTAGLDIASSTFYRCTYAMVMVLPDCSDITVTNSTFDTVTSTSYANTYTFATGGSALNSGQRWTQNLTVTGCTFLNNPRWEGLDTHGAENVTFQDNHIENCRIGIMAGNAANFVADPRLSTVLIEGNTVIQGTGMGGHFGIVVNGGVGRAQDIIIRGNTVRGFGGTDSKVGSITVYRVANVTIEQNTVIDFGMNAVCMYYEVFGARIATNIFRNLGARIAGQSTAGIAGVSWGCHNVTVTGNELIAESVSQQVDFFIRAGATNQSWQIGTNTIATTNTALYAGLAYLPVAKSSMPTAPGLQQKGGDVLFNTDPAQPTWIVTSPSVGYGATVVVNVAMTAGSTAATVVPGGTYDWRALPPGMNIVIDGAGAGGDPLSARIVSNDHTVDSASAPTALVLNTAAATTVSAAPVRFQPLSFTAA